MIQLSTGSAPALAVALPGAAPIALPAATEASSFALALDALLVPGAKIALPAAAPIPPATPELAVRQALAAPGKDLPPVGEKEAPDEDGDAELPAGSEPDQEEKPDGAALPYVWMPAPLPVETPAPALPAMPQPGVAAAAAPAVAAPVLPAIGEMAPITSEPAAAPAASEPGQPIELPILAKPVAHDHLETPVATSAPPRAGEQAAPRTTPWSQPSAPPVSPAGAGDAPVVPATPAAPAPAAPAPAPGSAPMVAALQQQPASAPQPIPAREPGAPADQARSVVALAPAAPAPARAETQPTAAVIAAAFSTPEVPAPLRRTAEEPSITLAPQPLDAGLQPHQQVRALAQADGAPIDMRRQEWTGQMIERIEAMRDASPVRDTRIRLAPDALGNVDVAIRHEGDRVHVHFTAETPAARQMLTEAQPRLTELAEARGLKLGQTSVEGGAAGQGGQRHDATPRTPSAPASARTAAADGSETDDRIA
ncbi:MAG: flagellar hook-length control protein FliK [Sphingomonas sp.]|uniref:flagellar hook-length control protein FliK n=1 Tax=Sphingomonas sp. TaxID=28214 RepID=UPI001B07138C|nr:flagellar hook-length control protein FliK [Sphingomonas sp.]MBO9622034.1 flagellar hook-length control protein FliK [Sphingomonas sp.]